jgi:hypothetical protein
LSHQVIEPMVIESLAEWLMADHWRVTGDKRRGGRVRALCPKKGARKCAQNGRFSGGLGGKRGAKRAYLGPRKPEKSDFLRTGGVDGGRRGRFGLDSDIMSGCTPARELPPGVGWKGENSATRRHGPARQPAVPCHPQPGRAQNALCQRVSTAMPPFRSRVALTDQCLVIWYST